ncbi:MAG: hypothetical protein KDA58_04115 [Planctomycetaceae bacterium]|nr:hypothetical protein [Planctomycetaceae bacterium]
MSYVGKILVVLQVVLSVLFMTFAGAVYAIHSNWNGKYTAVQTQLNDATQQIKVAQEELETAKTDFNTNLKNETERANRFQAEKLTLEARVATLEGQNNTVEQQRDTEKGLAQAKAAEARFRQEEAERRRIENDKLQVQLDTISGENRSLKDQIISKNADYDELIAKHNELLEQSAYLERIVAAYSLPTNPREVAKLSAPAPPVEGLVRTVKRDKTNRVKFVELTIGSDDGLLVGHSMDVVHIPSNGGNGAEWLGKVKVVSVNPDSAVAEVILAAKNGIIQEGDNVTTKL